MSPLKRTLVTLVFCALAACAERPRVNVHLVHSPALSPSTAFQSIELRVFAVDGGGEVARVSLLADRFEQDRELADLSGMVDGLSYRAEVVAEASVCSTGRAVGRSLPFQHRDLDYQIPVHIGCADELFALPRLNHPRISHSLVPLDDGSALIGGGARTTFLADGESHAELVPQVERYNPSAARFSRHGTLALPRAAPAGVRTTQGVGWIGGTTLGTPLCTSSVELSIGESTAAGATMQHERCEPSAVHLSAAEAILVVGGHPAVRQRERDLELLGLDGRTVLVSSQSELLHRSDPALVALSDGRSALVLGGQRTMTSARVARIRVGDGCDLPCVEEVSATDLPIGWTDVDAARVSCADGRSAVYAVGGASSSMAGQLRALDTIYCAEDTGGELGVLRSIGRLPSPRRGAKVVVIRGRAGHQRLLVVGGVEQGNDVASEAFLVDVGCGCESLQTSEMRSVPAPIGGVLLNHEAATLADGSVLVVGGFTVRSAGEGLELEATGEAALFVPELDR